MVNIGSARNFEEGEIDRNEKGLSKASRDIIGPGSQDTDMIFYDKETLQTEVIVEATSSTRFPDWQKTGLIRKQAKLLNAYVIYILQEYHDDECEHPIVMSVWDNLGKREPGYREKETTWADYQQLVRDIHEAYLDAGLSTCKETVYHISK